MNDKSIVRFLLARRSVRLYRLSTISIRTLHRETKSPATITNSPYDFVRRHLGPNERQTEEMLKVLGLQSLNELVDKTVPSDIQFRGKMNIPEALRKRQQYLNVCSLTLTFFVRSFVF